MRLFGEGHRYRPVLAAIAAASAVVVLAGCGATTGGGGIILLAERSRCVQSPYDARIYVTVALQNTGAAEGKTAALPIRRYSDGTTNASPLDELVDLVVPAGETRIFRHRYDYNALSHELLECSIRLPGRDPVAVAVIR